MPSHHVKKLGWSPDATKALDAWMKRARALGLDLEGQPGHGPSDSAAVRHALTRATACRREEHVKANAALANALADEKARGAYVPPHAPVNVALRDAAVAALDALAAACFAAYGPASRSGLAARDNGTAVATLDPLDPHWPSWLAARAIDWTTWADTDERGSVWPG